MKLSRNKYTASKINLNLRCNVRCDFVGEINAKNTLYSIVFDHLNIHEQYHFTMKLIKVI